MLRWINKAIAIVSLLASLPAFASELKVETLVEGAGIQAEKNKKVTVHYEGRLEDGTIFDASKPRGQPFSFTIGAGQVIEGWELGVAGMKVGEQRRLTIPPNLAYGKNGTGDVIPPNATLVFDIELLSVADAVFLGQSTPEDLIEARSSGVAIIDIRREGEWLETGIIDGANTIKAFQKDGNVHPDFLQKFNSLVSTKQTPVLLYCRTGNRTTRLGNAIIEQLGFTNVSHLRDGIIGWKKEGQRTIDYKP